MTKYLFVVLLIVNLIGCNKNQKNDFTYLGGKIINPKSNFIILKKSDSIIDSIMINDDNTFLAKYKSLNGFYNFKHGSEHQYFYIEPKDSLLFRINTWDFDESLVFSGENSIRNNSLLEAYLQKEEDYNNFKYIFNKLDINDFLLKTDSIINAKEEILERYSKEYDDKSKEFLDIYRIALTYPTYTKIEQYLIDNYDKIDMTSFKNTLLKHREFTNINRDSLMSYTFYRNYVYTSLHSDIYQKQLSSDDENYSSALLKNVNSKIKSTKLKNRILRIFLLRHFYRESASRININTFDTFLTLSTNPKDRDSILKLMIDVNYTFKNNKYPKFDVVGYKGKAKRFNDIIKNKKYIVYFRNDKVSHDKFAGTRFNFLVNKYTDLNFILVNINERKKPMRNVNPDYQFYLPENSIAHSFLTSKLPRIMLVDDNGTIIEKFTSLSSPKIEKQIASLIKK